MRILFITPYVPSLFRVRPYNLIKYLSQRGHRISLLSLCTSEKEEQDAELLKPYCERLQTVYVPLHRSLWNCLRGLGSRLPLQALYCYSPAMRKLLEGELNSQGSKVIGARTGFDGRQSYDLVHIEHLRSVIFGLDVTGLPRVYDSVDCISLLFEKVKHGPATPGSRLKAWLDLERTKRFEGWLVGQFERVLITSEADRQALAGLHAHFGSQGSRTKDPKGCVWKEGRISVLPNGVDLEYFKPIDQPHCPDTLLYLGRMSYHANISSVLYLVHEIMPLIWAKRPSVRLLVVGKDPPREIRALSRPHGPLVTVTGYVPDVRPYLARATVSVNPMVYAVGIQNKVLEAMAMETPVVATPAACASLSARDGDHLLVGHSPAQFANQVLRLLEDQRLQQRIGSSGRRYVEQHHDWDKMADRLEEIYREAIEGYMRHAGRE